MCTDAQVPSLELLLVKGFLFVLPGALLAGGPWKLKFCHLPSCSAPLVLIFFSSSAARVHSIHSGEYLVVVFFLSLSETLSLKTTTNMSLYFQYFVTLPVLIRIFPCDIKMMQTFQLFPSGVAINSLFFLFFTGFSVDCSLMTQPLHSY